MITEQNIEREVNDLEWKLKDDIALAYNDFLAFIHKYAKPGGAARREGLAVASDIFAMTMPTSIVEDSENGRHQLTESALEIIYRIKEETKSATYTDVLGAESATREKDLERMPAETKVFQGYNISKSYSGAFSLKHVDLTLHLGEITAVIGENGTGKTTLLRIVAGDLEKDTGSVSYPFIKAPKLDWTEVKQNIGFVQQRLPEWSNTVTVSEVLHFTASIKGRQGSENVEMVEYLLRRLNLYAEKDKHWNELSGGYKLRFEVARQLVWSPKLLVLDEPLANLDLKAQLALLNDLRHLTSSLNHSMAVLVSTQSLYDVERVSDRIVFLSSGKVKHNGPMDNIAIKNGHNSFELDVKCNISELHRALNGVPGVDIRDNGIYKIVATSLGVKSTDVLKHLMNANIEVRHFRDISNSTRFLFEQ